MAEAVAVELSNGIMVTLIAQNGCKGPDEDFRGHFWWLCECDEYRRC